MEDIIEELFEKYDVKVAVASEGHEDWVRSKAEEVNLNDSSQVSLVKDLNTIMTEFVNAFGYPGVSSNNLFWNGTEKPIRVILVKDPQRENDLTLVNPIIKKYYGNEYISIEGCASFPNRTYIVRRSQSVNLEATLFDNGNFKPVELTFESVLPNYSKMKVGTILKMLPSPIVQHEVDHINGIVLPHIEIDPYKISNKKN